MQPPANTYPTAILPCADYRRRLPVERLLQSYPLLVVRQVPGRPEDYMGESEGGEKMLLPKVFQNSMANLSMNLAGGLFDTDKNGHLGYLPANDAFATTWRGGDVPVEWCEDCKQFTVTQPCFGLCFRVADVHRRTFPFYKHFDSETERDEYARKAADVATPAERAMDAHVVDKFESKKKSVGVRPRLKVHHAPTTANYWHMTLDTYRPTEVRYIRPEERQSSADKKMFISLKQDLLTHARIDAVPDYRLEEYFYRKDVSVKREA